MQSVPELGTATVFRRMRGTDALFRNNPPLRREKTTVSPPATRQAARRCADIPPSTSLRRYPSDSPAGQGDFRLVLSLLYSDKIPMSTGCKTALFRYISQEQTNFFALRSRIPRLKRQSRIGENVYNPQKKRLQTGAKGYKIVTFCAGCWDFLPKLEEKSAPPENGSFFVQPAKSSFENSSQTPENPPFSPGKSAFFRIFKELLYIFAYNFNFSAEFPFFLPPRTAELPPHCRGFSVSICRKPPSFTGESASADHSDAPVVSAAPRWFPLRPGGGFPLRPGGFRCASVVSAAPRWFPLRLGGGFPLRPGGGFPLRLGGFRCASVVSAAPRWFPLHPGGFRCAPAVSAAPRWFPLRPGGFRCTPGVSAAPRRFPLHPGGFRYAAADFSAAAACLQENAPVFAFPGRRLSRRGSANRGDVK